MRKPDPIALSYKGPVMTVRLVIGPHHSLLVS